MSLCLLAPALALSLAVDGFTLRWTHSVERIDWQERWAVRGALLVLEEARVQGSGAGMEPADDAVLRDGWWVWRPRTAPVPALHLALSGATGSGWQLCTADAGCRELETMLGPTSGTPAVVELRAGPCPR